MGKCRGAYRVLVGKPEGKRQHGTDNIKMDLQAVGWGDGMDWPGSGWGQVVGSCEWGNEPLDIIRCGEFFQ